MMSATIPGIVDSGSLTWWAEWLATVGFAGVVRHRFLASALAIPMPTTGRFFQAMAYVCIDVHTITGYARDVAQRSSDTMLRAFKSQPGFVECDFVVSDTRLIAISTWRSKEHATESAVRAASSVVNDTVATDELSLEQHYAGQLSFTSRAG